MWRTASTVAALAARARSAASCRARSCSLLTLRRVVPSGGRSSDFSEYDEVTCALHVALIACIKIDLRAPLAADPQAR